MNREEIAKSIINIIGIQTGHENVEEKDNLSDDLIMDSLDKVECVIMIEKHFSIHVPDAQVEDGLKTVGDAVDIVEKLLKVKNN